MASPAPAARRVALGVWVGMLAVPVAFLGVSEATAGPRPEGRDGALFWVSVASSAVGIAVSRALPRRLARSGEGANPEVVAFTRLAMSLALAEAVAMFPLVARIVEPDPRLLWVFAADLLALAALFPSRARWSALARPVWPGAGRAERS